MEQRGPVVLLAAPGMSTNIVYHALRHELGDIRVVLERPVSRRTLLSRRLSRLGLITVAGQVLFQMLIVPVLARTSAKRARQIHELSAFDGSPIDAGAITHVVSVNSGEAIAALRDLRPSVVVVNGTRILGREVLAAVDAPFVNMHAGITPAYRGVHGGYWALAQRDPERSGVTVHRVDEGIDTGGIIGQAVIAPTAADSFVTYPLLQLAAGLPLLIDSVRAGGRATNRTAAPATGHSAVWTHPTLWGYLWTRITRGVR